MTEDLKLACTGDDKGNISVKSVYKSDSYNPQTHEGLFRLILKDGVITTEPMKAGESAGSIFTVEQKLVPLFFEAIKRLGSDGLYKLSAEQREFPPRDHTQE